MQCDSAFCGHDWELIEEYTTGNVRTTAFVQGAHGPIKSLLNNIYFYQDSLGSTSHIASTTGALLEYYKYDLNGKPTYWNASNTQIPASAHGIRDLFTGERYVTEMGMYDLRNRYYSPDLGRFLQPDPIGFKGDGSNLYRYCGNDWANRTDPDGLIDRNSPLFQMLRSLGGNSFNDWLDGLTDVPQNAQPAGNDSNSMAKENEGAKGNDQKSVSGAGVPATVTRSAGASFTRTGTNGKEIAVVRFVYTVKDASGKSVGGGIPVGEKVTFSKGVDAPPPGANKSWTTNSHGQVRDTYSIPFDSPRGRVNITQSLLVGAGTSTLTGRWETVVRANGSFNMIGETPSGDTMNLH
jgi:RHS repeat-associated protein